MALGAVSPEDLIKYAHRISQSCSVVSPVGWQISECHRRVELADHLLIAGDPRRPFPQDIEMRRGFLGQLTSGVKPQVGLNAGGSEEMVPPPEKKFALAGMNSDLV